MPVKRTGRPAAFGPKRTKADAVAAAERRAGKASRVVSIADLSNLTGYDRETVSRGIERGCPVEPGKGAKGATLLELREVMTWREEQARTEGRRSAVSSESDGDEGDETAN